ncbi:PPC domain-containing protein [Paraconexibacter sp.]|uniref:PPC domain-containing protein n=1 Tax=Paraconexibacter sp. TaxID=2949640 RepID=UPI0035666B2E
MQIHRTVLAAALAAAVLPSIASAHTGRALVSELPVARYAEPQAAPEGEMTLTLEQSRFWLGGQIDNGNVLDASLCDVIAPCPEWQLRLTEAGSRLRVAIDTPSREDSFELQVLDAAGAVVGSGSASNQFNGEAFVAQPAPGVYTVRVVPKGATQAFFRLRAKLEKAPEAPADPKRSLLPNLKAVPPYEFNFTAPANPANGLYPPDTVNPPLAAAGYEPVSCAPDELAPIAAGGQGAIDCLRLTSGPINVGEGPFVKKFYYAQDTAAGSTEPATQRGPASQTIYHADGSTSTRPAGHYSFHNTHAHFHDEGILTYELFRVIEGRDGKDLTPAGIGTKSGFCPADQLFGEWRTFTQDPTGMFSEGDTATGSCFSPNDGTFALTRGWGDVYRWQRPGQFVEWSGNTDGYFVVRTTVDKGNVTLESDETDNSSYALIKVTGRRIETIERGQGLSHLDPTKEVFTGFGPASRDPFGGDLPPAGTAPAVEKDDVAPKVTRLRFVKGRGTGPRRRRAKVRFAISESATVKLTVTRTTGSGKKRKVRRVGTMRMRVRKGTTTRVLSARLERSVRRKGSYTFGVVARDTAGNTRAARPLRLRVR